VATPVDGRRLLQEQDISGISGKALANSAAPVPPRLERGDGMASTRNLEIYG
jgi:hypothetical protein